MKSRQLHRAIYYAKQRLFTLNNIVIFAAGLVALSWISGSLSVMQRNYSLQRTLAQKNLELKLSELETRSLELEQSYYKTREYQELSAREKLGYGSPGEKVLILPLKTDKTPTTQSVSHTPKPSELGQPGNFQQWVNFFFGNNQQS